MSEPMDIKDYIPARVLLLFALTALGGFFLLASSVARPSSAASCTMVVGYSVTRDWFNLGSFETQPGIVNAEWELLWDGGASARKIAYEDRLWPEWNADNITSRCASSDRLPDRIIYHVGHRSDETNHSDPQPVLDVVALIRQRINPNATIYLMGQVGSTTPSTCNVFGDDVAQDSVVAIQGAIAADPTLREAVHPRVLCSQFADSKGHLTSAGAVSAASQVAAWFASLSGAPPTATPTVTPAPTPTLVSCERVATYSDGSKVTVALPLGDC